MSGPASPYYLLMLDADAMRLPKIIQRGFFADHPVATFSTTPRTDDFHNTASLDRPFLTGISSKNRAVIIQDDTEEK